MPETIRTAKQRYTQAYKQSCATGDLPQMVKAWAGMVDILWAEWEDCTQLDSWIAELSKLRGLIKEPDQPQLLPYLAKGAFAALSIRQMDHPDFAFWEQINLQSLESELPVEERLLRSLQCMIHYTWGVGDQPRGSLVLDYLNIILRQDNSSSMVQCIQPVCAAAYQYWFDPDHQTSLDTVDKGLALSKRLGLSMWDVPMLNVALFQACSSEQKTLANHYLKQLANRLDEHSRQHDFAIYYHFKAYLAWLDGRHNEALFAAEKALDMATQTGFSFSPLYYKLAIAQILASLGQRARALRHISSCRKTAHRYNSRNISYLCHIIGASITLNADRKWMAKRYLKHAIKYDPTHTYQRIPWLRLHDITRLARLQKTSPAGIFNAHTALDQCRIITLGKLQVITGNRPNPSSHKLPRVPLTLLLHLIAAGPHGLSREVLVERIWPETNHEKGNSRLKTTLHRLRGLLGCDVAVHQHQGYLALNPEVCQIDSWEFERHHQQAVSGDINSALSAIALYQGGFDSNLTNNEALLCYRSHLEKCYAELVLLFAAHHQAQNQPTKALAIYQKALALDPTNEDFCINTIKLLHSLNRSTELRRTLEQCRSNWASELSIDLPKSVLQLCDDIFSELKDH